MTNIRLIETARRCYSCIVAFVANQIGRTQGHAETFGIGQALLQFPWRWQRHHEFQFLADQIAQALAHQRCTRFEQAMNMIGNIADLNHRGH